MPPHSYYEFNWSNRPPLTVEEFNDPVRSLWKPTMFLGQNRDDAMRHRLTWGSPMSSWDEATTANSNHSFNLEDHPEEIQDVPLAIEAPIVSQMARGVLERVAPNSVQYLPVIMTQRGSPIRIGRYWVVNVITLVDCLEPEPGSFDPYPPRIARYMPDDVVQLDRGRTRLLAHRVPPEAALFRLKREYLTIVARSDVKDAFVAHGITGVRFDPLDFVVA